MRGYRVEIEQWIYLFVRTDEFRSFETNEFFFYFAGVRVVAITTAVAVEFIIKTVLQAFKDSRDTFVGRAIGSAIITRKTGILYEK